MTSSLRIVVHGGARSGGAPRDRRRSILERAADAGTEAGSPIDAVVEAIAVLESAPPFNAGVGGAVQSDGVIRTDAGIMRADGEAGAACAMAGVANAIRVARVVMERTPHVLLAGEHAVDLAAAAGIETGVDCWTPATRRRWAAETASGPPPTLGRAPEDHLAWVRSRFGGTDTVGAVATDGERVAAGTSTGGRWFALAGRVGDVPQIGAGFYCSEAGGASATGHGEEIARTNLARRAVERLEDGYSSARAAAAAIEAFRERAGREAAAGVIVAAIDGPMGRADTTDDMQTARRNEGG